ncbi:MAG: 6-phosphogluconolactonase [Candidatus Saccharimonadales bacterium]
MKYIYTQEPIEQAAKHLADVLKDHLSKGERVLWLLSGGSSIPIAVCASRELKGIDLSNLYVSLTDERFGKLNHIEENWKQLLDEGLDLPGANLYRPLNGRGIQKTTEMFSTWLIEQFASADYKIGIFGLGADGHTCGIKPESTAVSATNLATSFLGDDHERITITFTTIKQIDEAIIQASGSGKRGIISDLLNKSLPLKEQPAQILKAIPKSALYTDNKKEDL